jgi:dihydroflavonol-4-reductase
MVWGRTPLTARGGVNCVDVRDLAELHARAMTPHSQPRRYPAFGHRMRHSDIHAFVCREANVRRLSLPLPNAVVLGSVPMFRALEALGVPIPASSDGSFVAGNDVRADNAVSERELGIRFRPLEDTLREMVAWLRAGGHLPPAMVS